MPDTIEAIYRILAARALAGGEQRLPLPPGKPGRLDQLAAGQQVEGRVLAIANGKATVLIGNQQVRLTLPVKAAVGDTFRLVFAGNHPRPTFVLAEPGRDSGTAVQADETAQVPGRVLRIEANGEAVVLIGDQALRLALPAGTQAGDTFSLVFTSATAKLADGRQNANISTQISDAGQLLGAAMEMTLDRHAPAQTVSPSPLLGERPANPAALALALRLALSRTGLFYESHLHEWLNGNYPLSSLLEEPQGRYSDPALLNAHGLAPAEADGFTETVLLQLIAQQLQLLENQSLVWHGEAWPGQPMEWKITRQDENGCRRGEDGPPQPQWKTRIVLDLPRLGKLAADIFLDSRGGVEVRLAGEKSALALLEAGREEVAGRLAAAGCRLNGFTVIMQHARA